MNYLQKSVSAPKFDTYFEHKIFNILGHLDWQPCLTGLRTSAHYLFLEACIYDTRFEVWELNQVLYMHPHVFHI
jgi:hypothetical protein